MDEFKMFQKAVGVSVEEAEKKEKLAILVALAREVNEQQEKILFPGINSENYSRMKADEEEFPGLATPIDDLIVRFKNEGMKVVLEKSRNNANTGNVFVLPVGSDNIEDDGILIEKLQIEESLSEKIRELILLARNYKNA